MSSPLHGCRSDPGRHDDVPLYLLGAGVLLGTRSSMQAISPGTTTVTNWFARRRSLAMGIFLTAGGLGGFIAAPGIR